MVKLILLFRETKPDANVLIGWSTRFVPQAERMPGLRRVTVSHVEGGPAGPSDVRLIHELYFDDRAALTAAMGSPEGIAAGETLVALLGTEPGAVEMLFAEHQEGDVHGA
ncbi:MAG: EthD family reductase [Anaerolineales bacterium]|nr:EthD family reductase [Anaerolineales bacterium]